MTRVRVKKQPKEKVTSWSVVRDSDGVIFSKGDFVKNNRGGEAFQIESLYQSKFDNSMNVCDILEEYEENINDLTKVPMGKILADKQHLSVNEVYDTILKSHGFHIVKNDNELYNDLIALSKKKLK